MSKAGRESQLMRWESEMLTCEQLWQETARPLGRLRLSRAAREEGKGGQRVVVDLHPQNPER